MSELHWIGMCSVTTDAEVLPCRLHCTGSPGPQAIASSEAAAPPPERRSRFCSGISSPMSLTKWMQLWRTSTHPTRISGGAKVAKRAPCATLSRRR